MNLYNVHLPTVRAVPVVANVPHSGRFIPPDIAAQFTQEHLLALPNSDWHLDKLYSFLPDLGITVLEATHSRYVVDLNRKPVEPFFGSFYKSVVAEQDAFERPIYRQHPTHKAVLQRVQEFHTPYHKKLSQLLEEHINIFGKVYLLDLHSFFWPADAEVIVGDDRGRTCSEFLTSCIEEHFSGSGYHTVRNQPYAGGYITRHHSQVPGVEAVQIEIRYHTYLQESQLDKPQPPENGVPEFCRARAIFRRIFASIVHDISTHGPGGQSSKSRAEAG